MRSIPRSSAVPWRACSSRFVLAPTDRCRCRPAARHAEYTGTGILSAWRKRRIRGTSSGWLDATPDSRRSSWPSVRGPARQRCRPTNRDGGPRRWRRCVGSSTRPASRSACGWSNRIATTPRGPWLRASSRPRSSRRSRIVSDAASPGAGPPPRRLRRPVFDPGAIVAVLNRHQVRFVVIGGMAAMVRDPPVPATVEHRHHPGARHREPGTSGRSVRRTRGRVAHR